MTREQLVRVFPDQRTVYVPSDGRPLAGYELALADIRKRGECRRCRQRPSSPTPAGPGSFAIRSPSCSIWRAATATRNDGRGGAATVDNRQRRQRNPTPLRTRAKAAARKPSCGRSRAEDKTRGREGQARRSPHAPRKSSRPRRPSSLRLRPRSRRKTRGREDKLAKVASKAHVISRAEAAPLGANPNQVILARGFWQGVPDGMTAARPAQRPRTQSPQWRSRAGSPSPAPMPPAPSARSTAAQRIASRPKLALAYAAQARSDEQPACLRAAVARDGTPARRAHSRRRRATGDNATTVAVKRVDGPRRASVILTVANQEGGDGARGRDPAQRSVAARHRRVAEREPLPLHHDARRARLPLAAPS